MATLDQIKDIQELYVAYFSRPADPAGLDYWADQLDNNPNVYQDIAAAFSVSAEYRATYADMDNRAIVSEVYEHLFGRVAESAGVDYWAAALDNRTITIDNVVTQIADGAQGADSLAFTSKVAVAAAFTDRVDTDVEMVAYSGARANQIAIDYIAGVRDLPSAADHLDTDNIDDAIAHIVGTPTGIEAVTPYIV